MPTWRSFPSWPPWWSCWSAPARGRSGGRSTERADVARRAAPRDVFFREADAHGVGGLTLARLLKADNLPPTARVPVERRLQPLRRRAALLELRVDRIVTLLREAGIEPVLLKGAALAGAVYDDPAERDQIDLDLLVPPSRVESAVRALEGIGYRAPSRPEVLEAYRRHHFHLPLYHEDSHIVEVHWGMGRNELPFQVDPSRVLAEATPVESVGRPPFLVPPPELIVLHLVLQCVQEHFSRFSRIVDADRIVHGESGIRWNHLVRTARAGGLAVPAAICLELARDLLGTNVPRNVTDELLPSRWTRTNLELFEPREMVLERRLLRRAAAAALFTLWLAPSFRSRIRMLRVHLLGGPPLPSQRSRPSAFERILFLGKILVLQGITYARGLHKRGQQP